MSGHLIGCAGALEYYVDAAGHRHRLPTSHKLALLAFADSADDRTHIGFAGYAGVQKWAVCSRARAAELIRDLCTWGLLEQHATARPGRRAEYVVLPLGCCELHRPDTDDEVSHDVDELARIAGVDVDQARRLLAAIASPGPDVQPAPKPSSPARNGSDAPDTSPRNGSDAPDPFTHDAHETTAEPVENPSSEGEWVQNGSDAPDPSTTSTTSPLPPPASRQGRCAAHPAGRANCRACGTTPRQLAAAAKRAAAERSRAAGTSATARDRQARASAADPGPGLQAVRAAIVPTRTTTKEKLR